MLDTIDFTIELGKIERAKELLREYYKKEHKSQWLQNMRAEYETVYPSNREMTDEEKAEYDNETFTEVNPKPEGFEYPIMFIDYSKDEDYRIFDEWLNETRVVKEAVTDDEGNIIEPEVTELVRLYVAPTVEWLDSKVQEYLNNSKVYKEYNKKQKEQALNSLKIEANTVLYDANGRAIGNMASVVSLANWKFNKALYDGINSVDAYQAIYKDTTVNWKGADNLVHTVQVESICKALENSMYEVAKIVGVA